MPAQRIVQPPVVDFHAELEIEPQTARIKVGRTNQGVGIVDQQECAVRREVIPWNLLRGETVPSAELSEAQDITRGLGDPIKYGYHDALLRQFIEMRCHLLDVFAWLEDGSLFERLEWRQRETFLGWFADTDAWLEDLEWVERQLRINYFKRVQAPPIIVLSKRAFGFDLRESQLPEYRPRRYAEARQRLLARDLRELVAAMR
jgi:NAD+ synthase (glutamine-hydrolysing)